MGKVKTRLAAERGDKDAVILYSAFLQDTAAICAAWQSQKFGVDPNRRLVLCVADQIEDPLMVDVARKGGARIILQSEGDLGERLTAAFQDEFDRGARSVCAVGGDSPTLPSHLIEHAFRALQWERVVIGPTFDGGYWLVGAQRPAPEIFSQIPWSTAAVTLRTLAKLRKQNVDGALLPFWYDIDSASDLERLAWHLTACRSREPSVGAATWKALKTIGIIRE